MGLVDLMLLSDAPSSPWLALDTFDRADSAVSMGNAEKGGAWTVRAGTGGISSGKAYFPTATAVNHATLSLGRLDFAVSCDVLSPNYATGNVYVMVRWIDTNNFVIAGITSTAVNLFKRDGGTFTLLATAAFSPTNSQTYGLLAECRGAVFTIKVDGVLRVTHTLSAGDQTKFNAAAAAHAGIYQGGSIAGLRWDNLRVRR